MGESVNPRFFIVSNFLEVSTCKLDTHVSCAATMKRCNACNTSSTVSDLLLYLLQQCDMFFDTPKNRKKVRYGFFNGGSKTRVTRE
jgi:hypothetical protein